MDIITLLMLFASVWLFDTIANGYPQVSRWLFHLLEERDRVKQIKP
ncbi:MAG: hypothetical protein AB4290_04420 [Spirulina sp.]